MLATGIVAGLVGMHVTVVRPTRHELDDMRRELAAVRSDLDGLVGRRDQVWNANTLLAGLDEQSQRLAESQDALETIRRFRLDVEAEGAKTLKALAAVDMLAALQQTLVESGPTTEAAVQEVAEIRKLNGQIAAMSSEATTASETAERLARMQQTLLSQADKSAAAEYTLRRMIGTQDRLIEERQTAEVAAKSLNEIADVQAALIVQSAGADDALATAAALAELKETVAAQADDVYVARQTAAQLASLRDELVYRSEPAQTAAAYETAESLISLRDLLGTDPNRATIARKNLDVLLTMQSDLAEQTAAVVEAVTSLELLADLRGEIVTHIGMMEDVRRDLIELATMESIVARAVRVIEPLANLGNLRRLSEDEIRTAARVILDDRAAKSASSMTDLNTAAEPVPAPQ